MWDEIAHRIRAKALRLVGYVPIEDLGADQSRTHYYSDSGAPLRSILKMLTISPPDEALDLGCGKGGAVLTLSQYFSRADGVDISESLVAVGRRNLERTGARNASLFVSDAAGFQDLHRYKFFHLFNPFPREVMEQVVRNIMESMARCPRRIEVLYMNPFDGNLFEAAGCRASKRSATDAPHKFILFSRTKLEIPDDRSASFV